MMDELFEKKTQNMLDNMYTCTLAEIIAIDFPNLRCDVQPLYDKEATPILDVPFGFMQHDEFMVRFPYRKGDKVFVGFCKEDMAPVLFEDDNRDAAAERQFTEDDAFIIGGLHTFTKPITPIPSAHDESFLICRKDFKAHFAIDNEGNISVETNKDISLKGENISLEAKSAITLQGGSVTANGEDLTTDLV